jgi:hypothetical protein
VMKASNLTTLALTGGISKRNTLTPWKISVESRII